MLIGKTLVSRRPNADVSPSSQLANAFRCNFCSLSQRWQHACALSAWLLCIGMLLAVICQKHKSHQKSFTHSAGNHYGTGSVGNIDWPFNMNDFFAVVVTKRDQIPTLLVSKFPFKIASGERRHAGDT